MFLPIYHTSIPSGIKENRFVSHVTVVYLKLTVSAWVFSGPHKPPFFPLPFALPLHSPKHDETQPSCFKGRDRIWLREDLTMKCTFQFGWALLIFDDKWVDEWVDERCANRNLLAALVCSDCQNKVPQSGGFKQQNRTLSHHSGGWKFTSKLLGFPETSLPGWQMAAFSLYPPMAVLALCYLCPVFLFLVRPTIQTSFNLIPF